MLSIVTMENNFWKNLAKPIIGLAPMDGVSDAPFRYITAKYGHPSVTFTEFTNVEALSHGAVKALAAFIYHEIERPIVAQIYGTNPEAFYKACFVACELGFDGIDINMGCPSKSVSGNGGGASLIRTPMLAQEIIQSCQQAVTDWQQGKTIYEAELHRDIIGYLEKHANQQISHSTAFPFALFTLRSSHATPHFAPKASTPRPLLPISIKTRVGYDRIVTEDWIKTLLECRPANISLHGRTLRQMYTGQASWEEIAKAATIVHNSGLETTILGNGDIKSMAEAEKRVAETGVDGVLIGRGAFGNPWIFEKGTGQSSASTRAHSIEEKLALALEHALCYESIFGIGARSFAPMKKHLGWYCTDFPHAKELRMALMACNSAEEVTAAIKAAHLP